MLCEALVFSNKADDPDVQTAGGSGYADAAHSAQLVYLATEHDNLAAYTKAAFAHGSRHIWDNPEEDEAWANW